VCKDLGIWDILILNFTSIGFTNFYLDVSSLIVTTSEFVKKKNSKETSKKICENNGSQ
jgi:hypothetical protein